MSTLLQPWAGGLPQNEFPPISQQYPAPSDIHLQTVIKADVRRVFHAVCMPEYREAWLCPPDGNGYCRSIAGATDGSFGVDFYRAGFRDLSVNGRFQVYEPDQLIFTWQKNMAPETSLVHIHLQGDALRSVLSLRHTGLSSSTERVWHQKMWSRSLEKLGWLLERFRP